MSDKKCPHCGLWNSGSAIGCDCGYDFEEGIVKEILVSVSAPPSTSHKRSIKAMISIFASSAGIILAIIVYATGIMVLIQVSGPASISYTPKVASDPVTANFLLIFQL